jgi:hypothetical protein
VSPAQAAAACPGKLRGARLAMARGAPSTISGADAACSVWADTGEAVVVTPELARPAPRLSCPARSWARSSPPCATNGRSTAPTGPTGRCCASPSTMPPAAWYVSSRSGEVVAHTTRFERGWSWLGTVPHWLYFTPLRGDDTTLWRQLVLWLPPLALLTVAAGLALGPSACACGTATRGAGHALPGLEALAPPARPRRRRPGLHLAAVRLAVEPSLRPAGVQRAAEGRRPAPGRRRLQPGRRPGPAEAPARRRPAGARPSGTASAAGITSRYAARTAANASTTRPARRRPSRPKPSPA